MSEWLLILGMSAAALIGWNLYPWPFLGLPIALFWVWLATGKNSMFRKPGIGVPGRIAVAAGYLVSAMTATGILFALSSFVSGYVSGMLGG